MVQDRQQQIKASFGIPADKDPLTNNPAWQGADEVCFWPYGK